MTLFVIGNKTIALELVKSVDICPRGGYLEPSDGSRFGFIVNYTMGECDQFSVDGALTFHAEMHDEFRASYKDLMAAWKNVAPPTVMMAGGGE